MRVKQLVTTAVCAALLTVPAQRVMADKSDVVSGIIGGIIGGVIVNEANKSKAKKKSSTKSTKSTTRTSTKKPVSTISAAQRAENREVQTALNYFNYPVGTPDGQIGPKSRDAISRFQRTLGYPETGQLTEYERTVLISAYHRAVAGGPAVQQAIANHPRGVRGVILMQRDEMAGVARPGSQLPGVVAAGAGAAAAVTALPQAPAPLPAPAPQGGVMAAAPAPQPGMPMPMPQPQAPAPQLPVLAATPEPAPEPAAPALPSFLGQSGAVVSLASHCNQVGLATTAAGGMVTLASMSDPNTALSEQFCLSRAHVMADGETAARNVPGFTPQQIAEQCAAFGPVMQEHVAALSLRPAHEITEGVEGFVLQSGMSPAQLSATARICLGVGYASDDMDVALGSALLLATLGEAGYAELLGHHLSQGFGAARRADLSLDWYEISAAAGAGLVPGMPERADLILQAAWALNGRALTQPAAPAIPVFAVPVAPAAPAAPAAPEVTVAPALPAPQPAPQPAAPAITVEAPAPEAVTQPVAPVQASAPRPPTGPVSAVSLVARLPYVIFGN